MARRAGRPTRRGATAEGDQKQVEGLLPEPRLRVSARVGQPRISYTDKPGGQQKKKPVKYMKLEIPVTEGAQYRMGEPEVRGPHGAEGAVRARPSSR